MNSRGATPIDLLEVFDDDRWSRIVLVTTNGELVAARVPVDKRGKAISAVRSTGDPYQALGKFAAVGGGPFRSRLEDVMEYSWCSDVPNLSLRTHNGRRFKQIELKFSSDSSRDKLLRYLDVVFEGPQQSTMPASIWYTGRFYLASIIGLGAWVALATSLLADDGNGPDRIVRGRDRLGRDLLEWFGSTNVQIICVALMIGLGIAWYRACQNPPDRFVVRLRDHS